MYIDSTILSSLSDSFLNETIISTPQTRQNPSRDFRRVTIPDQALS
jgi:hypothetical protein